MMARDFKRRFFIGAIVTIPILVLSPTIQNWLGFAVPGFPGDKFFLAGLASVVALWASWPFYVNALSELRKKTLGMMVLVSLAVGVGYLYSLSTTFLIEAPDFYWEISTLAVVLLFGHWMEMRAVVGASGSLKELVKLIPPKANKVAGDDIAEVETETLLVDDIILIRPGEKVPVDAVVLDGESSVNEALLTGESKPVGKKAGDGLIGGSLNIDGSLKARVLKIGKDTALSQIVELVKNAQSSKPKTQRLADKAAHYLTLTAIIVGVLTFFFWNFLLGASFVFALTLAITVIVITCPHALGLAIPTVTTISSALAAKHGILIKNMDGLEKARDVDWIIFDKTGTLTKGEFGVSDVIEIRDGKFKTDNNGATSKILQIAASLENHSEHVIAKAVVAAAKTRGLKLLDIKNAKAIPGKGISGIFDNAEVIIGTGRLMAERSVTIAEGQAGKANELERQGKTVVYLALDKQIAGMIALSDLIKEESKAAIQNLKDMGVKVAMLTGDNKETAAYVAEALGLDHFFAEVLPGDKVNAVRELQRKGSTVMMVGDGVNDAPALTQADVGVAIGAGTDVAIESAEIVLVKNNPQDIVRLIRLSRKTTAKMKQNLAWATGYNIVAIPLAAGVLAGYGILLRPEWGALAMTASSIIVVFNALLLRKAKLSV